MTKYALIVVDMQNDFMDGGALAVEGAVDLVYLINNRMQGYDVIVGTRDWHPPNHCSFKEYNGLWPSHCVAGTNGAEFVDELDTDMFNLIINKGLRVNADSYSAFKDDDGNVTGLAGALRELGVEEVHICGVARNYCVEATAVHAREMGFEVIVAEDLCRSV